MPIQCILFGKKPGDAALQTSTQYKALNSLEEEENR